MASEICQLSVVINCGSISEGRNSIKFVCENPLIPRGQALHNQQAIYLPDLSFQILESQNHHLIGVFRATSNSGNRRISEALKL